ncbi:DUF680 domain-containing protein [Aminobacter sp. AP02]|uniref:DUF680 domain-containing protein n=1 Tax=Aminobacter sp. AP02 TaxID=2135737 RepID=UPI000D6A988A|nr:DUF680 domain-containing protein [Aminobacter sp. AP02]PWK71756.1 hypothetical protein C8K44_106272 [Aminobacter sp. AP02]
MRRTILALAAMLATSGLAMAKDTHNTAPVPTGCSATMSKQKVDCATTGSIKQRSAVPTKDGETPRLGFDMNPWIVPPYY